MTVYVDDAYIPARVGRYSSRWCHLFCDADDAAELHKFAARIGLRRSWFQPGRNSLTGEPDPTKHHYDVTASKRRAAVTAGAVEISALDAAAMRMRRRGADKQPRPGGEGLPQHPPGRGLQPPAMRNQP